MLLLRRSQKSIAIFGYKQSLLSVDMKTKVVQHVERERVNERVKVVKVQLLSDILTLFGHY